MHAQSELYGRIAHHDTSLHWPEDVELSDNVKDLVRKVHARRDLVTGPINQSANLRCRVRAILSLFRKHQWVVISLRVSPWQPINSGGIYTNTAERVRVLQSPLTHAQLLTDAGNRITYEQIVQHSWFKGHSWEKIASYDGALNACSGLPSINVGPHNMLDRVGETLSCFNDQPLVPVHIVSASVRII